MVECYYKSDPERTGFRKQMFALYNKRRMPHRNEQRIMDQKKNIFERKWLADLEEIAHKLVEIRNNRKYEQCRRA